MSARRRLLAGLGGAFALLVLLGYVGSRASDVTSPPDTGPSIYTWPPPSTTAGDGSTTFPGRVHEGDAAVVARIVDGDTLHVTLDGRDVTVRLIGVDTPEVHKPGVPVQCYGPEAAQVLASLVPVGSPIHLTYQHDRVDRYGRTLADVWRDTDGSFVNLDLVEFGAARTLTIRPNVDHAKELAAAETAAQHGLLGLWGACGTVKA